MQLGFILVLLLSVFIAIFAIQNGDIVSVDLFFASYKVSQALVILISVGLGAIIAGALGLFRRFKRAMNIKDLNKKISFLEEEKETFVENIKKLEQENKKLETFNTDLKSEIEKLEDEIEQLPKEQEDIKSNIEKINEYSDNNIIDNSDETGAEEEDEKE